ncbi:MAG: phenylacetate--CoA ligase family protein [Deltaproteobacteria bacterium]|nr:phenylacetate--CoA ligase family protein [Deltaproteobacteria bacterium]
MSITYGSKRAVDVMRALAERRRLDARERWSRDELLAYQRARVAELVAFACRASPFYRERFGLLDAREVDLEALPTLDKVTMMNAFDRIVTDPRVRLERLEPHLATLADDDLFEGEHRVMTSSGSSGRRGVYVYDRSAWVVAMAGVLRWLRMLGAGPRLPRRRRSAAIGAPDGKHMTYRMSKTLDVGIGIMRRLSSMEPIERLCGELDDFQPEVMNAYPSIAAMLASEQLEGRLRIRPRVVCTSSEMRTAEMTEVIRRAWGVMPFDCLGLTETGILAVDCSEHRGMHVFEDLCVFEVVGADGKPASPRTAGARVLITNLFNRTQPLVRFEVTDLVTVDDTPCACGRSSLRITAIDGRTEDVLLVKGKPVHPLHLIGPISAIVAVRQYQVVQQGDRLVVSILLAAGAGANETSARVRSALSASLASIGAGAAEIEVCVVDRIAREEGAGKVKLVKRDPRVAAPPAFSA